MKMKAAPISEPFDPIHALLRKGEYENLLSHLFGASGKLRPPFTGDANHAWYVAGDAMFRSGNFPEAINMFKKSFKADPADDQAALAVGNCYFRMGNLASAERWLRRSYELSGSAAAGYDYANVAYDRGDFRTAIAIYKSLQPGNAKIARLINKNLGLAEKKLNALTKLRSG